MSTSSSASSPASRSESIPASSASPQTAKDPNVPTNSAPANSPAASNAPASSTSAAAASPSKAPDAASSSAGRASTAPSDNTTGTSTGRAANTSAGNTPNKPASTGSDSTDVKKAVSTGQSSNNASTSVVTNHLAQSTTTNTITSQAESTFSTPVGVTTTDSTGGKTSVVFPPLVTVLSTTENADGSIVTATHIIANPTGSVAESGAKNDSFLQNQGAVAGVFLVVGIAVASLFGVLFLLCRRRRKRRQQRQQWIASIQRRLPDNDSPFRDQEEDMRQVGQVGNYAAVASPSTPAPAYNHNPHTPIATSNPFRDSFYENHDHAPKDRTTTSPFSDTHAYRPSQIGIAVSTDVTRSNERENAQSPSRPSLVQSSPSIYPPTLPLSNDDVSSIYEEVDLQPAPASPPPAHARQDSAVLPMSPTPPGIDSDASGAMFSPPRPPRSVLREVPSKIMEYRPLTPPESSQGHPNDDLVTPPSPISSISSSKVWEDYPSVERRVYTYTPPSSSGGGKPVGIEDIVNRRTLLDIRPRPSADNLGR
ncbi:hypothetical protein K435DRAFT_268536 [Dendrothele bispora CBS 962.96]|uniref:REJ domain-containing protein n=1 Tax=Dendrothele bispora (strain CBS 962.96) TaxID=1314807 RepID=A0A4S8MWM2_DENBC|nr:hypothetical protein K435DRAFT_268536 [Dendrothele bispora CBS 962.96]